jgi:hypothetical protein
MRERGDVLVGLMVVFLLAFSLGSLVHVAPRFAGSLTGGILGMGATLLMLLTLPYVAVKHISWLDRKLAAGPTKPTWLAVHVYAGVLGPVLALVHAAHKLDSPVGLLLTGSLLLVVLTGYVGRYLLGQTMRALRGRKSELASLQSAFLGLPAQPVVNTAAPAWPRWRRAFFIPAEQPDQALPTSEQALAGAVADVEFAIRAEEATKSLFAGWRLLHIVIGIVIYALAVLHIGAAIYYGLRWW